jgi:hypothetical protein
MVKLIEWKVDGDGREGDVAVRGVSGRVLTFAGESVAHAYAQSLAAGFRRSGRPPPWPHYRIVDAAHPAN